MFKVLQSLKLTAFQNDNSPRSSTKESCKIKNKLNTSYSKREEPGYIHSQIEAKLKSRSANILASEI